jgi:large subunit ribosomal protein L24
MANSLHVKKGDRVKVIAGKDKGVVGEIIEPSTPKENRVIVEGVNLVKKHTAIRRTRNGRKNQGRHHQPRPRSTRRTSQLVVTKVPTARGGDPRRLQARRGDQDVAPTAPSTPPTRSVRIARKPPGEEI